MGPQIVREISNGPCPGVALEGVLPSLPQQRHHYGAVGLC